MTSNETVGTPRGRLAPPAPLLVAMALAALSGAAGAIAKHDVWAYHLGASIWGALLIWAIAWHYFLKRRGGQKAWAVYLWIYAAMATAAATISLYQTAEVEKARAGVLDALGAYDRQERDFETTPKASGEAGEIEAFVKRQLSLGANARRDYEAELTGAGLEKLFSKEELSRRDWLAHARYKLGRLQEITAKYEALSVKQVAEAKGQIEQLDLSEATKQQMLEGLNDGQRINGPDQARVWQLEKDALGELSGMVDVLARAEGHWAFEGGRIAFDRTSDLEAFQRHSTRAQELGETQEALTKKLQSGLRETLQPG